MELERQLMLLGDRGSKRFVHGSIQLFGDVSRELEQVARECHVDRAYLCRLFRRYDQQTPYRFLMRLKMNLAAERLQHPGVLVKQVAAQLGFDDPFHFSRTFKSMFGVSPQRFRRLR